MLTGSGPCWSAKVKQRPVMFLFDIYVKNTRRFAGPLVVLAIYEPRQQCHPRVWDSTVCLEGQESKPGWNPLHLSNIHQFVAAPAVSAQQINVLEGATPVPVRYVRASNGTSSYSFRNIWICRILILRSDSLNSYGIFQPVWFRKDMQGNGALYWWPRSGNDGTILYCYQRAEDNSCRQYREEALYFKTTNLFETTCKII